MAYTASGISPDGGSTWFLPRLVGLRVAQRLALENPTLSAQEALKLNIITRVVPDEELAGTAMETARRFADGPTLAYGRVKQLFAETWANGAEHQMELETLAHRRQRPHAGYERRPGRLLRETGAAVQGGLEPARNPSSTCAGRR